MSGRFLRLPHAPERPHCLAGGLGFEPRFSESESDVLPLNYPPKRRSTLLQPFPAEARVLRARTVTNVRGHARTDITAPMRCGKAILARYPGLRRFPARKL